MSAPPVYIGTVNDANGNPRRGWILGYGTGEMRFCDEGYKGSGALRAYGLESGAAYDSPMIRVTPGEYASWRKFEREAVKA